MNIVTVQMFPALSGDCFLISCNGKSENVNILVDMGFKCTYEDYLKNKLLELKNNKQNIDLLVVSHIDQDHISGAITLLQENGESANPKIIEINEIWHNSFRHLQIGKLAPKNLSDQEVKILKDYTNIKFKDSIGNIEDISFEQGSTLASYIYQNGYKWNSSFNHNAVCIEDNEELPKIKIKDATITLLSPLREHLTSLYNSWKVKLSNMGVNISSNDLIDDAYEVFMLKEKEKRIASLHECAEEKINFKNLALAQFVEDAGMTNASSIAFIIEWNGFKMLMTGDSYSSVIENGLKNYLQQGGNTNFDIVKISHHGSQRNTSLDLLKLIKSKYYLISTNANHHPEIETIARIITSNTELKTIVFNYEPSFLWRINSSELKSKYHYDLFVENNKFSVKKSSVVEISMEKEVIGSEF